MEQGRIIKRRVMFLWGASWWVGLALSTENYAEIMKDTHR